MNISNYQKGQTRSDLTGTVGEFCNEEESGTLRNNNYSSGGISIAKAHEVSQGRMFHIFYYSDFQRIFDQKEILDYYMIQNQ